MLIQGRTQDVENATGNTKTQRRQLEAQDSFDPAAQATFACDVVGVGERLAEAKQAGGRERPAS